MTKWFRRRKSRRGRYSIFLTQGSTYLDFAKAIELLSEREESHLNFDEFSSRMASTRTYSVHTSLIALSRDCPSIFKHSLSREELRKDS